MNKLNKILANKNNRPVKNRHNRGAAMIVVVCVMSVVMILSFTLLMTAYQMLATVSDEGRDEMYYQQAISFSKVLTKSLEGKNAPGATVDDLVTHIDDFMGADSFKDVDTETLNAAAPAGVGSYGGITLVLDKKSAAGKLVVAISVNEGDKKMVTCTCKYDVTKANDGTLSYKFSGYY